MLIKLSLSYVDNFDRIKKKEENWLIFKGIFMWCRFL